MRYTSYSFVIIALLVHVIAVPVNVGPGIDQGLNARAPPPRPPASPSNSGANTPGTQPPAGTPGQPPQPNPPKQGSPAPGQPQQPTIGSGAPGKPQPNANPQAGQIPSGLDSESDYLQIPRNLLPPSTSCPAGPPKSQTPPPAVQPPNLVQKQPPTPGQNQPLTPGQKQSPKGQNQVLPIAAPQPLNPPKRQGAARKRNLVLRARSVFVGFRGTSSAIAQSYRQYGIDGAPASGNAQRLGDGMYLTDDIQIAASYAQRTADAANEAAASTNALGLIHQPVRRSICTIFAEDETYFRDSIPKVFLSPIAWAQEVNGIPHSSPESLAYQRQWIGQNVQALQGIRESLIIKFTSMYWQCPLEPLAGNQMFIPRNQLARFYIGSCTDYDNQAPEFAAPTLRNQPPNKLDYRDKYQEWNILGRHYDYVPAAGFPQRAY